MVIRLLIHFAIEIDAMDESAILKQLFTNVYMRKIEYRYCAFRHGFYTSFFTKIYNELPDLVESNVNDNYYKILNIYMSRETITADDLYSVMHLESKTDKKLLLLVINLFVEQIALIDFGFKDYSVENNRDLYLFLTWNYHSQGFIKDIISKEDKNMHFLYTPDDDCILKVNLTDEIIKSKNVAQSRKNLDYTDLKEINLAIDLIDKCKSGLKIKDNYCCQMYFEYIKYLSEITRKKFIMSLQAKNDENIFSLPFFDKSDFLEFEDLFNKLKRQNN